jgi:HSP90 family molecular chaperone
MSKKLNIKSSTRLTTRTTKVCVSILHDLCRSKLTNNQLDPLTWSHFKAEGDVDFKSILFIPSKAPPSYLQKADQAVKNMKLYVRRVFITDEVEVWFTLVPLLQKKTC